MTNKLFERKPVNQTILGRIATRAAQHVSVFELRDQIQNRDKINKQFSSTEAAYKTQSES